MENAPQTFPTAKNPKANEQKPKNPQKPKQQQKNPKEINKQNPRRMKASLKFYSDLF